MMWNLGKLQVFPAGSLPHRSLGAPVHPLQLGALEAESEGGLTILIDKSIGSY
jgi:hypothetical protein